MDKNNKQQSKFREITKDLMCGSIGGLWGTVASHPLDTIRIRLQLQTYNIYKGIIDWAQKTIKLEGVSGLYKGMLPPIIFQCPTYAFLFAGKEFGDKMVGKIGNFSENTQSLLAGCVGGWFSTIVSWPAELLKIRSQNEILGKTDYVKLARNMIKQQGMRSLYKGYLWTLVRDIPAFAVYFGCFEIGWSMYTKPHDPFLKKLAYQLLFGSIAGIASWLITYPIDVIKSIIQSKDANLSIREVFQDNYRKHGMRFFWKGMLATSIRAVPMEATCLIMYTQLRELI